MPLAEKGEWGQGREPLSRLGTQRPGARPALRLVFLKLFERDGRVGFIDPNGRIIVDPAIVAPIEDVGDFSNGLARVDDQGYVDETGRFLIRQNFWSEHDFSDGLAQVLVDDQNQKYGYLGLVIDPAGRP